MIKEVFDLFATNVVEKKLLFQYYLGTSIYETMPLSSDCLQIKKIHPKSRLPLFQDRGL